MLSPDGAYVLLASEGPSGSWELAQVSTFTSFAAARPIPCVLPNCTVRGFVPHSDEVYGFQCDPSSGLYKGLVFVDPKSLVGQLGPTGLPDGTRVCGQSAFGALEVIQRGDHPDDATVVYDYQDFSGSQGQDYCAVTNLRSGKIYRLTKGLECYFPESPTYEGLLGWIP